MRTKCLCIGLMAVVLGVTFAQQARAQNVTVPYYAPQFYVDRLVFYDQAGTPIYYEGDTAYSVPRSYAFYNQIAGHYRDNEGNYERWYAQVGYANLHYRRPVTTSYYQPLYYQEYPVYYDDGGQPIYYVDGSLRRVPRAYGDYHVLVGHYRARRAAYRRWYAGPGRHYRWYRRPIRTGYYRPQYHEGYVVFYDNAGRPYYHRGGRSVFIAPNHRLYRRYVSHYRQHRAPYSRWYRSRGRHHHGYRRSAIHRRRVVNRRAHRSVRGRSVIRTHRRHRGASPRRHRGHVVHRPGRRDPRHTVRVEHRPGRRGVRVEHRPGRRGVHVEHRPGRRVRHGRPARHHVKHRVDCRRQPGHPACRGRGARQHRPHARPRHRRDRHPAHPPRGDRRRRRHR